MNIQHSGPFSRPDRRQAGLVQAGISLKEDSASEEHLYNITQLSYGHILRSHPQLQ